MINQWNDLSHVICDKREYKHGSAGIDDWDSPMHIRLMIVNAQHRKHLVEDYNKFTNDHDHISTIKNGWNSPNVSRE